MGVVLTLKVRAKPSGNRACVLRSDRPKHTGVNDDRWQGALKLSRRCVDGPTRPTGLTTAVNGFLTTVC